MGNLCNGTVKVLNDAKKKEINETLSKLQASAFNGNKEAQWTMHIYYRDSFSVNGNVIVPKSNDLAEMYLKMYSQSKQFVSYDPDQEQRNTQQNEFEKLLESIKKIDDTL